MSNHDEVFGLPFLFTGGLPNSLEKFTEGNLRCFLIYLIEVVGKANRQNVWQKPAWWRSKLIPYSPINVDTRQVPQDQVVTELRNLVESCYRFYKAEKILEVSRQLAEIPRILLGIRDNFDNTMTVFDTNSKAVYVTVRPENLYYDTKSLNKVSKDWKSNYTKEDGTFCKIDKARQENHNTNEAKLDAMVIELSDSDTEDDKMQKGKRWSSGDCNQVNMPAPRRCSLPSKFGATHKNTQGVVIRSGNDFVIALSDSEDDEKVSAEKTLSNEKAPSPVKEKSDDEEVEFVSEYINSRPCPKRFKKQLPTSQQTGVNESSFMPETNIIVVSDSDGEASPEDTGVCISSYTSLAKNFQHQYFVETPNKNAQKSILGPLMFSPRKTPPTLKSPKVVLSPLRWPVTPNKSPRSATAISPVKKGVRALTTPPAGRGRNQVSSDDDDILKPTKEELYLRKKKKRTFYSTSPSLQIQEPPLQANTQSEFMALLGMKDAKSHSNDFEGINIERKEMELKVTNDLEQVIRSMRSSLHRMPLEWLQILSSKHFLFSKRCYRPLHNVNATRITYEPLCSTNKSFVEYSIKAANTSVGKEGRSNNRQGRRGADKNTWTVERWCIQSEEGSQRAKRYALRMLRSLSSGDNAVSPKDSLCLGTLAPTLNRLPNAVFESALHSTVNLKDIF